MNKPVAWIVEEEDDESWAIYQNPKWAEEHAKNMEAKIIPLYTHPVKELKLTNDEIREIGDECILNNNGILNWIEFAKAILRKAQEK